MSGSPPMSANPSDIGNAILTPLNLMTPTYWISGFSGAFSPILNPGSILNPLATSQAVVNQAAKNAQVSPTSGVPVLQPVTGNDMAVTSTVTNNAANNDAMAASQNATNGNVTLAVAQKNLANAEKRLADIQANLRGIRELTPAQKTVLMASQKQVDSAKQMVANLSKPNMGNNPSQQLPVVNITPPTQNLQSAWDQVFGGASAQALGTNTPSAAGIPANPAATAIANGLTVMGNPANIPASYMEWKKNADMDDYLAARKYMTWKSHCNGRPLDDWTQYDEWKPTWNTLRSQVCREEFNQWRMYASEEDASSYKEWRKWRSIKQHFKSKYEPYRQRNLSKKQKVYKRFLKRADIKEFKKYARFLVWAKTRNMQGQDIYDISAWQDWVPTYIENCKSLDNQYYEWRNSGGSRDDFNSFVAYLLFRKVKRAYKEETEASSESCPDKFYKDDGFLRRHRRYWKSWNNKWNKDDE